MNKSLRDGWTNSLGVIIVISNITTILWHLSMNQDQTLSQRLILLLLLLLLLLITLGIFFSLMISKSSVLLNLLTTAIDFNLTLILYKVGALLTSGNKILAKPEFFPSQEKLIH
jgi:hypothetical protein